MAKNLSIAREFKKRALQAMPRRVAKIVLHGSRARGDARKTSDWDLAVFVKGQPTTRDRSVLSHISYDLMMETGEHVQALPFPASHERLDYSFYRTSAPAAWWWYDRRTSTAYAQGYPAAALCRIARQVGRP